MRQTKAEIYLHFVWATRLRERLISADHERALHRCVGGEAVRLGCDILGLNGMEDHVHLLVWTPPRLSPAELMKQAKGVSSRFMNDLLPDGAGFRWQEGYGVFSVSRSHLKRVAAYVKNQKEHHATGNPWPEWEATDEEYVPRKSVAGVASRGLEIPGCEPAAKRPADGLWDEGSPSAGRLAAGPEPGISNPRDAAGPEPGITNPRSAAGHTVTVELLGVARLLARREVIELPLCQTVRLRELLRTLGDTLPILVGTVLGEEGELLGGHVLSRNGADLLRDPEEPVHPGDRLLLLSTAAGG